MSTPLSFSKLENLLQKHKYTLVHTYSCDDKLIFIELKTPKYNKTFYINILSCYSITNKFEHNTNIYKVYYENENQKKYLSMFQNTLKNNLLCISPQSICLFQDNYSEYYSFNDLSTKVSKESPKDYVSELKEEMKNLKMKLNKKDEKFRFVLHTPVPKGDTPPTITIIFKDENDQDIEPGSALEKLMIEAFPIPKIHLTKYNIVELNDINVESNHSTTENTQQSSYNSDEESKEIPIMNNKPELFENEKINVGMIYICIDISTFFKQITSLEEYINKQYELFETKEYSLREQKMKQIEELIITIKNSAFEQLKEIQEEEKHIKLQVQKLTSILLSCNKLSGNEEASNLSTKTKNTLDELNLNLIKLRDKSHNLLDKYVKYIEDMNEL